MKELIEYAKKWEGVPYIWAGNHPLSGMDCSGYIQWVLSSVGMDPKGDQTAQLIYRHFKDNSEMSLSKIERGALIFYGRNIGHITHVDMGIDRVRVIGAMGGDRTTTTLEDAAAVGAMVQQRQFGYRKDVVAILMPQYSEYGLL